MRLNSDEIATILAALRYWQINTKFRERTNSIHFESGDPLTDEEIDDLCEKINCEEE